MLSVKIGQQRNLHCNTISTSSINHVVNNLQNCGSVQYVECWVVWDGKVFSWQRRC